jgi:hypothetical protein
VKTVGPAVLLVLLLGCSAEIGDECGANVDCSPNGDRVCDLTAPGGYCTILGCIADSCPEESVCVAWDEGAARRTFCMRHCGSDSDCRDGYQCFDPARWAADHGSDPGFRAADYGIILDASPGGPRFCTRDW